jgi:hypothetical protein
MISNTIMQTVVLSCAVCTYAHPVIVILFIHIINTMVTQYAMQEETCFTIVDHQNRNQHPELQQPCDRRRRHPEPVKRPSCRSQQASRVTAGNRFTASVVNRYRSLSSFFARSSSVIGPANSDALPTRVAYHDGVSKIAHDDTYDDRQTTVTSQVANDRRPVSIVIAGPTSEFNDAFDNWCVCRSILQR